MLPRFETERLLIRPWQPQQDAAAAFAIYGDPEVMRFIRSPDQSVEAVQRTMETVVARYAELNNGTGSWAIVEKATGDLVGGYC